MNSPQPNSVLAWLRLLRIPNLPSAIANILMAYLLVHLSWSPTPQLILLILASSSLYLAGMVLNDVFDIEIDREQRPSRPLPSGEIPKRTAMVAGYGLIAAGILLATVAGWLDGGNAWLPLMIACLLGVFIFLYDGPMKRTIAAPFLMGGCRSLNVLLGASTFAGAGWLGFSNLIWWVAISIGGLIAGATLLGRKEAVEHQSKKPLLVAGLIIVVSLIALALAVYCPDPANAISEQQRRIFPLFIALISFPIVRRVGEAIFTAKPKKIQAGVVSVLRSLIIFDAALCYLAAPSQPVFALAVLMLLFPTMALGRFIPST